MKAIKIKRIYDEALKDDEYRVLIDRLWPRGISKEDAALDEWNKELSPSTELRKWFDHTPERFEEFSRRYRQELEEQQDELKRLYSLAKSKQITLLYAARDEEMNNAVVLRKVLNDYK
ncbi:MAG: DUF488 domain-containing protein [Lentimicrobiaceae bacterium]|nr:DUF488 domain-containing protein [Lentimicrobiaceae bacterium]